VRYDDIVVDGGGLSSELPPIDQLRKVLERGRHQRQVEGR
jgi:hypothetical protein